MPRYENYPPEMRQSVTAKPMGKAKTDSLTWKDLRELRRVWPRTLLIKGILSAEDAREALACGVDGIIVSNHGARMLDSSIPPLVALPDIAAAVAGRVPVLIDGHITRGGDVVKALALGASAVLVGRSTLYGLAVSGREGASHVLAILQEEIVRVIGLIRRPTISQVDTRCLAPEHVVKEEKYALRAVS